jgi:hypothetical protein
MMNTQGHPKAAQLLKLLHKFKSLSVRIDVGPFTTLLRSGNWLWDMPMGSDERIGHAPCVIPLIPHPLYSPSLAPCDFLLFPKMKLKFKGCWLDTTEKIQAKLQRMLDTLDRLGLPGSIP